jgi:predicted nucleotide-binding protein
MEKAKIFIGSSGRALILAQRLRDELSANFSEATVWNDASQGQAGLMIIEMLENATREYDFAVLILTRDDVVFREGGDTEKRQARDNCIFEAGLFMGALGRQRCFLVSGVRADELPVDLRGIIYYALTEPADFESYSQCKQAIVLPSGKILEVVQKQGPRKKRKRIKG